MSTLIIHPKDLSTDFLKPIYAPIKYKTVITGNITKAELINQIYMHDQVLMLGHGSPMGLFSVNQFTSMSTYIVDESVVDSLRKKSNNVFIWCHANLFVKQHGLAGFNSGMFLSRYILCVWYYFIVDFLFLKYSFAYRCALSTFSRNMLFLHGKNLSCIWYSF